MTATTKRPSATRIAIWSWRSLLSGMVAMAPLFLTAFALWWAVGEVLGWLFGLIAPPPAQSEQAWLDAQASGQVPWRLVILTIPYQAVSTLITATLLAPVAVAMHRFVLLDEVRSRYAITPTSLYFAGWLAAFQFAEVLHSLLRVTLLIQTSNSVGTLISIIYWTVLLWTVLLFPSVALEERADGILARLETALERTKGNFWWILRAMVLTFCWPFLLGLLVLFLVNLFAPGAIPAFDAKAWGARLSTWPFMLAYSAIYLLMTALAAATASWLFRHATKPGKV